MSDIDEVIRGLQILRFYEEGEVNMSRERVLYAGPDFDDDEHQRSVISEDDRNSLQAYGWEFDEHICRWGWVQ